LTADDWKALKQGDDSRFGEKERAALSYAEKLTKSLQEITDPDVQAPEEIFL